MAGKTKRKAAPKKPPAETKAASHAKKQMWAVVLFALGILMCALTFIQGDKLWATIHIFLFGLFGWSAFLFGPLMLYISVIAAMDKPLSALQNKLWQVIVLIILVSGAIQIFGDGLPDEGGFFADIQHLFTQGVMREGGGVVSMFIALPLIGLFEKTGASIIITLCICVFTMLITGSTLLSLFRMLKRPVEGIGGAYVSTVESREQKRQQRLAAQPEEPVKKKREKNQAQSVPAAAPLPSKSNRFDIDVDISKDSEPDKDNGEPPWDEEPQLPQHPVTSAKPQIKEVYPDVESPVEYISPAEFSRQDNINTDPEPSPEQPPARRHSLDDDILMAERQTAVEIGDVINKFISTGLDSKYTDGSNEVAALTRSVDDTEDDEFDLRPNFMSSTDFVQIIPPPPEKTELQLERQDDEVMFFAPDLSVIKGPDDAEPEPDENAEDFEPESIVESTGNEINFTDADPDITIDDRMINLSNVAENPPPLKIETVPAFAEPGTDLGMPNSYRCPTIELLNTIKKQNNDNIIDEQNVNAKTLIDTLQSFGVQAKIVDVCRGPAVTRYELQPAAGTKIRKITGLADDIALNLAAAGIRIEAPIPNKAAIGIEVPNKTVSMVSIKEIIDSPDFTRAESSVSVALGKDIAGNIALADIAKMPHMLIAGSTGSGKSVCINSIIISLLYRSSPDEVKLLMVDPKVVELGVYNGIPHLLVPVVTDPKKAAGALNWAVAEMLRRYKEFANRSVRDLAGYNRLAQTNDEMEPMPKIVIIIDELADLMMAAPNDVEDAICRLAQMARAAGMHLIIATQRPSVDVITGVIKANIPSRIAFAVSSQIDSRTILDMGGAEKLLGRGDMLFYPVGASKPQRVQGCFVTDTEVEKVVEYIKAGESAEYDQQIVEEIDKHVVPEKSSGKSGGGFDDDDEMLPQAIECVVEAGMASTSMLQRRLKLGYARAARIIDQLEERGLVGPFEGGKPRQVLITKDRWIEMKLSGSAPCDTESL